MLASFFQTALAVLPMAPQTIGLGVAVDQMMVQRCVQGMVEEEKHRVCSNESQSADGVVVDETAYHSCLVNFDGQQNTQALNAYFTEICEREIAEAERAVPPAAPEAQTQQIPDECLNAPNDDARAACIAEHGGADEQPQNQMACINGNGPTNRETHYCNGANQFPICTEGATLGDANLISSLGENATADNVECGPNGQWRVAGSDDDESGGGQQRTEEDLDGDGDVDESDQEIARQIDEEETQTGSTGGGGSSAQLQQLASQCQEKASRANQCCNGPLECLTNGGDISSTVNEVVGFGGQMAMQILGAQAGDNAGVAKLCEFLKNANNVSSGMNAAGAGTCLAGKNGCASACRAGLNMIDRCSGGSCGVSEVELSEYRGTFEQNIGMCSGLNEQVAQQAMQSVTAAQGAQYANDCAVAAEQEVESTGADDLVETDRLDCTKEENKNSPYCLECSGPTALNNPFCQNPYDQQGLPTAGIAQDGSVGAAAFGADDGSGAAVDPGMEGIEQNYYGNTAEDIARSNGVGGAGGAGAA
ncbi:MAG: hypothetical protein AAF329_20260 [Cyanobacteria bacterium P01_A01_bin.17]